MIAIYTILILAILIFINKYGYDDGGGGEIINHNEIRIHNKINSILKGDN